MDNTTLTDDLIAEIEGCRFTCETIGFHYVVKTLDRAAAELRSLRELVGPIEGNGKTIHHEGHMYYPPEMVHSLMARMRSMRADAERYRFLKDQGHFRAMSMDMGGNHTWVGMGRCVGRGCTVDAAIDTAMQATK